MYKAATAEWDAMGKAAVYCGAVGKGTQLKLVVNMDKDLPGTSGELPPMNLTFVSERSPAAPDPRSLPLEGLVEAFDDAAAPVDAAS